LKLHTSADRNCTPGAALHHDDGGTVCAQPMRGTTKRVRGLRMIDDTLTVNHGVALEHAKLPHRRRLHA
jgi:hypothetical protein